MVNSGPRGYVGGTSRPLTTFSCRFPFGTFSGTRSSFVHQSHWMLQQVNTTFKSDTTRSAFWAALQQAMCKIGQLRKRSALRCSRILLLIRNDCF